MGSIIVEHTRVPSVAPYSYSEYTQIDDGISAVRIQIPVEPDATHIHIRVYSAL